ncbi:MAG: LytTR family DNA-binding domain-containing protein, partial [Chitinophagaceae bacterium]|nr:LytTR family DNA-binding domain-containing protein [Chitinophagaceae bacterium]
MISAVIIEDEKYAARFLNDMLHRIAPDVEVVAVLESVAESLEQLPALRPDLILADIQLEDGLSLSIFEQLQWKRPVIFITAYDAYAIRAFKANGIDYLLKPCEESELLHALDKFRKSLLGGTFANLQETIREINNKVAASFKERFAVTLGSRIVSISVQDIAYFYYANRVTNIVKKDGQKFPYAESLDYLANLLNPLHFFRINRSYIIHHQSIERIENHG